jgi:hypothetical protein
MGAGDWIMAAGECRHNFETLGLPSVVQSPFGKPQWHEVFEGIPYILKEAPPAPAHVCVVVSSSGHRPYIAAKRSLHWTWQAYRPKPAKLVVSTDELVASIPFTGRVFIEPNIKQIGHKNKAWEFRNWQSLVDRMPDTQFVQCGPEAGTRWLSGGNVKHAFTPTFRAVMAVLAGSRAFVGTEGGLMHAAAGLGVPGVVLWSEFISPRVTGYDCLVNIRYASEPLGCGRRINCAGCRVAMQSISVDEVRAKLEGVMHA